ncbi:MAG: hypothetical protein KKB30_12210 [Proteobacteria bacterium]|nr:hypothetical protein [Pseudomonadota bacterium]MBU1715236.1 hypothetical protein [Pseudomonadota bacterium]
MAKFFIIPTILFSLVFATNCFAKVDWEKSTTIESSAPPLDVAISADGKWTFVLTEGGKVNIYAEDGQLNDSVPVDPTMNRLDVPGLGERIILSSHKNKTVQEIFVDFIVNIDLADSPFLGINPNAPVVIVAFSDFQ